MIRSVIVAFATTVAGVVPAMANILSQVAGSGTDVGPWVQLGGIGASVTGLAYMAKKFADGSIVAFPVSDVIAAAAKREETLVELVQSASDREDALRALLLSKGMGK